MKNSVTLLKTGLPLIRNILKPLAKTVLMPLGLTAAGKATDAAIHKKMSGSGETTLMNSNEEMIDIIKIIRSLKEYGLSIKDIGKAIRNEAKK